MREGASEGTRSRRVLPPVFFAVALAGMVALHWLAPLAEPLPAPLSWLGFVPALLGVAMILAAARRFERAGTTIKPFRRSSSLVREGPYRFTRNPMYLGMVLVLLGVALGLGSVTPFLVLPVFVVLIQRRFVRAEEALLAEVFGADYDAYRRQVRRWI